MSEINLEGLPGLFLDGAKILQRQQLPETS